MKVDPVASLRTWAVELDLAGRTFQIPAMPAADWLPVLIGGQLLDLIDMTGESDQIDELLLTGELAAADLSAALDAVVEQVCGRSVHSAVTLAQVANQLWPIVGGELACSGFRWDQQPIGAALDAIDRTCMRALNKEARQKIRTLVDNQLSTGRAGRRPRIDRERARADFEAMAGPPPTGVVPATAGLSAGGPPRTRPPRRQPPRGGPSAEPTTPPGPPA